MTDTVHEVGTPPSRTIVRRRRRPVGLLLTGIVAVGLVIGSDRLIRARQNLIGRIAAKDQTLPLLPVSELLGTKVEKKATWNRLFDRLAVTRSAADHGEFIKTTYELSDFINKEVEDDDPRRQAILLDLISVIGDSPQAANAYWTLFLPAWEKQLRPSYPKYTEALIKTAKAEGKAGAVTLMQLADTLKNRGEPALELQTLKTLHATSPVSVTTSNAMERLQSILPAGDPERTQLEADLKSFQLRRAQLASSMVWYKSFIAKVPTGKLTELEELRQKAPAGDMNAFTASADATLATIYVKSGRPDDANKLRTTLAAYDMADVEDCVTLATEASIDPAAPPGKPSAAAMTPPPDVINIQLNQWRGMLLARKTAEADALANAIFVGDLKGLRKAADDEKLLITGPAAKLTPSVFLKKRSTDLPPELAGASEALYGQFPLKPNAKTSPAEIHSSAEMWLGSDKVVVIFNADEPRAEMPASKYTKRDDDVWKEDSVELFFDPDHWYDAYYQIDTNWLGTVFDARITNTGTMTRRVYTKGDRGFNLKLTATPAKTATGWQMRFVLPRSPLFPENTNAIKFNVRRFRWTTENKAAVLHQYSWTGVAGTEHKPEQFGWVIISK